MIRLLFRAQLRRHLALAHTVAVLFFRRWRRLRGLWVMVVVRSRRISVAFLWRGFRLRGAVLGGVVACRVWGGVVVVVVVVVGSMRSGIPLYTSSAWIILVATLGLLTLVVIVVLIVAFVVVTVLFRALLVGIVAFTTLVTPLKMLMVFVFPRVLASLGVTGLVPSILSRSVLKLLVVVRGSPLGVVVGRALVAVVVVVAVAVRLEG